MDYLKLKKQLKVHKERNNEFKQQGKSLPFLNLVSTQKVMQTPTCMQIQGAKSNQVFFLYIERQQEIKYENLVLL